MSDELVTNPSLLIRLRDSANDVAWATFHEVYEPLTFNFCRSKGLQDADARDVTQDVLRAVSQAIGNFAYEPQRGTFRAWLLSMVKTLSDVSMSEETLDSRIAVL